MTERSNPNEVICPACVHQFAAIPENVQEELRRLHSVNAQTGEQLRAAVAAQREACAQMVERLGQEGYGTLAIAAALRQGDKS
jgi:hypothetical protein